MRGATRGRCHLIADRRLLLYFRRLVILFITLGALSPASYSVRAVRCYAGDPTYQHECTSLSYCLLIISRTGRSQWSCDNNSYNQISLCSNLGLMEDLITDDISGSSSSVSSSVIFESPGVVSMTGGVGRYGDTTLNDETLAEYYRRQEDSVRSALALQDVDNSAAVTRDDGDNVLSQPRHKFFFTDGKNAGSGNLRQSSVSLTGNSDSGSKSSVSAPLVRMARVAGRGRAPPASIRYYTGQRRCFDGGDLGRICCCSSDFCNGVAAARPVRVVAIAATTAAGVIASMLVRRLRFLIT